METIKNYLETMFANLPNTQSVRKAKNELLQMMEDKYNELISDGISENEAVGTIISEFGNLDELAEDLGLVEEIKQSAEPRKLISLDEVKALIVDKSRYGVLLGLGIFFCITSVAGTIIGDSVLDNENLGVMTMFIMIAIGVGIIVFNSINISKWSHIKGQLCQIDLNTADYVANELNRYRSTHALLLSVGIMLCAICWLPAALLDGMSRGDDLGGAMLFVFVGIGVMMIVASSIRMGTYEDLLKLNDITTVSGSYGKSETIKYNNDKVAQIMMVYWQTVTCLYFIWSFISFEWHKTWIIWPIAAVVKKIIDINFEKRD